MGPNKPQQDQHIIQPPDSAVKRIQQEVEKNQEGKNFVGGTVSDEVPTGQFKKYLKRLGRSVVVAFVILILMIIASSLYNFPAWTIFIGTIAFVAFVMWKSFLYLKD